MINIEYASVPQETADATLDFLTNRPFMRIMFWFMKMSCLILCIGFGLTLYAKAARPQDFASVFLALTWLFAYKRINRWIIKGSLKKAKFNNAINVFKIDHKSIFCKLPSKQPVDIEWKRLKYVYKNKDGYIIPITGITNGGKFIWLPHRGFNTQALESEFLEIANKFRLKIKNITG